MILTSLAALALAQSATDEVRLVRYPAIYGDRYVFTYASDLWIADIKGGPARRLTSHPGMEQTPKFSPDGKWIAFTGQYDGGNDIYVIPSDGGEPKRVTFEAATDSIKGWTPDGKKIAYGSTYGNHTNRMQRLWLVGKDGGLPERTDVQEVGELSFNADGSKMAFNRGVSYRFNWRRYRGGTQGRIAFWDFNTDKYTEIPTGREQSYFPMWVGNTVFYISDKTDGTLNLWSYDIGSKKSKQLTNYTDADIRWPETDGKTIIFEQNLRLHTYDIATGKTSDLEPRIMGDNLSMRPRYESMATEVDDVALSPSGKRVVAGAHGKLFSVPATRGTTRLMTEAEGVREKNPVWSADGQWVYALSDASGENKIVRRPQMGGEEETIATPAGQYISGFALPLKGDTLAYTTTNDELCVLDTVTHKSTMITKDISGALPTYEYSPDGNWIVYSQTQPNLAVSIKLFDIKSGKSYKVTDGFYTDNAVSFDQTGKYLYLVSSRTFGATPGDFEGVTLVQQDMQRIYVVTLDKSLGDPLMQPDDEEPVKGGKSDGDDDDEEAPAAPAKKDDGPSIDVDGIDKRLTVLPLPNGNYPIIKGVKNGVVFWSDGSLVLFSMGSKRPAPILNGVTGVAFNPDRSKLVYVAGPVVGITTPTPGQEVGVGRVSFGRVGAVVDPRKEYRQMFWDVWRYERDEFYDPDMLGLDWKKIGNHYASILDDVGDRSDLDYVFGMLIGELGTGHAYVQPGPTGADPMSPPAGYLGADYKAVGDKIVMTKIYRGESQDPSVRGPLGRLGVDVKDGEYLLAIDGKPVTAKTGVSPLLLGKGNQKVTLTVNTTPSMTGARDVTTVATTDETNLRYQSWVDERRALVDKLSDGQIGYMHVPDTSVPGIIGFMKGFYSQMDKKAWLVDERYNGGGSIPTFFIDYLTREFTNIIRPRHGVDVGLPLSLNGPKAMLINEHAGSGGDLFPYLFRKAGIGPLIGKRTWGGLVGIQGFYGLVDGGGVTAPGFGIYDPQTGKWIAENKGIDPDIDIDDSPETAAKGEDVQLEAGVKYLLGQIKNVKPLKSPDGFPRVGH